MLKVIGLVRGGFHTGLHLRDGLFQPLLFAFQRYRQRGKPFLTEQALGHVLVTFLDQPVYLRHPLPGLRQLPLSGGQFPPLLQAKPLHLLLGKPPFIDLDVPQQPLQALQHQFLDYILPDEMGGTNTGIAAVGGTKEKCLLPLVVVGGAVPQLAAAVGTIEQPGKHTDNAGFCGPAAVLAEILDEGEGLPVDDGGVRIGKHLPFLLGPLQPLLLLEGSAERAEIHRVAGVLLPVQNSGHSGGTPVVRERRGLCWTFHAGAVQILAGGHHALGAQFFSDLGRPQAGHAHAKDTPHHLRCRFIHQPPVPVLRGLPVPKGRVGGQGYSGAAPALHDAPYLVAGVFRVPLVE